MTVIPCGTEVTLKHSEYEGFITGIVIRDNRVVYCISYYDEGGTFIEGMFAPYEFEAPEFTWEVIGFKPTGGAL